MPLKQWRLNAPDNYRWTDEDVLHEKDQSFLNGALTTLLTAAIMVLIAFAILRDLRHQCLP